MCPKPELYSVTRGPHQGDLRIYGVEMKPLTDEDEQNIHPYNGPEEITLVI